MEEVGGVETEVEEEEVEVEAEEEGVVLRVSSQEQD